MTLETTTESDTNTTIAEPTTRPMGRPRMYETAIELSNAVETYFTDIDLHNIDNKDDRQVPTMTGLALAIGMNRKTLCDYDNRDKHLGNTVKGLSYSDVIDRARTRIEAAMEQLLYTNKGSAAGIIFGLKNNYSWVDKTETENKTITQDLSMVDLTGDSQQRIKEDVLKQLGFSDDK